MNAIKYSYMDHWFMHSPQGLTKPGVRREFVEYYIRQISALGFKGLDIFSLTFKNMPECSARSGILSNFSKITDWKRWSAFCLGLCGCQKHQCVLA